MLPLFKSHYSIGKSILTLNDPEKDTADGADSVFSIARENKLEQLYLIEDSLIGFLQANKLAQKIDLQLIFGLRISVTHKKSSDKKDDFACSHKVVVFAKNDSGCKLLNKIYSKAFCDGEGTILNDDLKKLWVEDDLMLCVPFYDSFIFMNTLHFCTCIPNFSFTTPTFFVEDNLLPFDFIIKNKVIKYCKEYKYKTLLTKSIYYKDRSDFEAYQTYKCICQKKTKQRTLNVPNIDHLGSSEFCMESFLENESS